MPRAGWKKPESDRRLSDLVSVGVLTRVFPPGLVDEVIAQVGRTEQRHRSLPARVMAYFSIGMALYSEGSYQDVLAQLTDGLSWASRSLLDQVAPGMLLLADRGFFSYALWRQAIGTGADLLWRVRTDKAGPKPV